jgi:hypothetical protein
LWRTQLSRRTSWVRFGAAASAALNAVVKGDGSSADVQRDLFASLRN